MTKTGKILSVELLRDLQPWGHLASWGRLIRRPSAKFTFSRSLGNFHSSQKASTSIICQSLAGIFVISRFILSKILWSSVSILGQKQNSEKVIKVSKVAQVLRGARNAHPALRTGRPCPLSLPLPHALLSFLKIDQFYKKKNK